MMDLKQLIKNIYANCGYYRSYSSGLFDENSDVKHMVIPMNRDIIEVPVFALPFLSTNYIDTISVELKVSKNTSSYKTLNSIVKDVLLWNLHYNKLIKLPKKEGEEQYYGSYSTLFDSAFNPVFMMSWALETHHYNDRREECYYKYIGPILRISPSIFLKKGTVERFIINKLLPTALEINSVMKPRYCEWNDNGNDYIDYHIQFIIEECPFQLFSNEIPSINTTNSELLNIVDNYITI